MAYPDMPYKQPQASAHPRPTFNNAQHSSSFQTQSSGFSDAYPMQPSRDFAEPRFDSNYASIPRAKPPPEPEDEYLTGSQRFNPRHWNKRRRIIVGCIVASIVLIIIIIVAAVEGWKSSRYPDYKPLTYHAVDTYEPATFFQNFQYWTDVDPAEGFVHYDSPEYATNPQFNTTFVSPQSAFVQVDRQGTNEITGRHSARVSSLKQYNTGLFLFDVKHAPYGCATWPAIWLADAYNWPTNGEIDVVEAANQAVSGVQSTLHTTKGCSMSVKRKQSGSTAGNNCYNGTDANNGCGVKGAPDTYGPALNANGGGVYATELRAQGIRVWFFPRAALPNDVKTSISTEEADTTHPDPSTWGEAFADFPSTDCDVGQHFRNQSIIVNIDLCGQWAGRDYATVDHCPGKCEDLVAQNPAAFNEAFWELGRFKVYQAA